MNCIRTIQAIFLALLLPALTVAESAASGRDKSDPMAVVDGNTAFAFRLYSELRSGEDNLFFSPFSISTALAMVYGGARGETAAQMAAVMSFSKDQKSFHKNFAGLGEMLDRVQKVGKVKLSTANAIWAQQDYPFLKDYVKLTEEFYKAGLRREDFRTAAEAARGRINRWVEEQTADKIKNLIGPGILMPDTKMVLVNAIYFKGDWKEQFKKDQTKDEPFRPLSGDPIDVPMMKQTRHFAYTGTDDLQILELPYAGEDLSMIILLPKEDAGLPGLEAALTPELLSEGIAKLAPITVALSFPRFSMTTEFGLAKKLAAMGMPDAFSDRADFSGMSARGDLFIDAVLHKAFVDVNEEGTEAAAATAVTMRMATAMPERPIIFRADHPFIFMIREKGSGSILFMGRFMKPGP
ncbi:MAG: serpin family protein [Candidatus Eisenbacteria bacterium]|uniref:Serpin family protein n=1 Tax=Eiseniibacteriota bacterium TaxID=2212470 RepID=A0A948RVD5_UNCEI|nr:serpin family protein [Candidatus Eisenbacteria bacterium]MBU1948875.1 serpin family protein [Candidatus Eisenbacteria bacterium]MBU2691560.1 serpin family protein [Candidatus Eisenbacteria bacterium]